MSPSLLEPRRLRESPQGPSSVEGRLARQLRTLSVYAPTPQLRRYSALPGRRRYMLTIVRVAALATVVLAVSGVAAATAAYVVHRVWSGPATVATPHASQRSPQARRPHPTESRTALVGARLQAPDVGISAVTSSTATVSSGQPSLPPPQSSRPAAEAHVGRVATHGAPDEAPPRPAHSLEPVPLPSLPLPTGTTSPGPSGRTTSQARTDGVTQEAGLLRQALSALRRDHDATRALALLDNYDWRFGQGALALEATSARAQALLQLGDNARALELLDRLPLWQEKYTGELRVIRGELRSLSGRCQEALSDFDDVLRATAGNAPPEVARALFGRASCRARSGDVVGAEVDRQRYLKEFPKGPAARQLTSPP